MLAAFEQLQHKRSCVIHIGSAAPQLSQVAAGFTLLHQQKELRVRFGGDLPQGAYPHDHVLQAQFDDGTVLLYDLADGYNELPRDAFDTCLDHAAFCFKRSFDPAMHQGMRNWTKIKPLGLNYHVTCPGSFFPSPGWAVPAAHEYMSHNSYPSYRGLFVTELLETPVQSSAEAADEIRRINELRIACLRACKERLGEKFYGGLMPNAIAQQPAPGLVLEHMTRASCLHLLKENFVCVNAEGPQRSLGWGMAECAATGRAILCPPPRYHLPGRFAAGWNYGTYETPEDCAERLEQALDNVPWIHRMEAANFSYYREFVVPDALVRRTLAEAFPSEEQTPCK